MRIPLQQSPSYERNEERFPSRGDTEEPCLVCGKAVKRETALFVEMLYTQELPLDEEHTPEIDGGLSQGWFPVGGDCWRRIQKAAHEAGGPAPPTRTLQGMEAEAL